jgi:hypothetical protein
MGNFNWLRYAITHGYITSYQGPGTDTPHYASDIATPFHTPITALLNGTVTQADYAVWNGRPGGGEVFVKATDGRTYYYYHLDSIGVRVGQTLNAGDMVGLSGGQNSGGLHPVDPMWSTGPHTHVGFFTGFANTPAGSRPTGPDITATILALKNGQVPPPGTGGGTSPTPPVTGTNPLTGFLSGLFQIQQLGTPWEPGSSFNPFLVNTGRAYFSMGTTTQQILNNVPGFYGMCLALDEAEQFPGVVTCSTPAGQNDFHIGNIDTGIPNPFAVATSPFGDIFCTIVSTITGNAMALAIRLFFILLGFAMLHALATAAMAAASADVLEEAGPLIGAVAKVAAA